MLQICFFIIKDYRVFSSRQEREGVLWVPALVYISLGDFYDSQLSLIHGTYRTLWKLTLCYSRTGHLSRYLTCRNLQTLTTCPSLHRIGECVKQREGNIYELFLLSLYNTPGGRYYCSFTDETPKAQISSFAWGFILFLLVKEKPFQLYSSKDVIASCSQGCKVSKLWCLHGSSHACRHHEFRMKPGILWLMPISWLQRWRTIAECSEFKIHRFSQGLPQLTSPRDTGGL